MLKLIVYLVLGFYSTYMEVVQLVSKIRIFKIGKLIREKLDLELDSSRKWATQNYSILKKRLEEQKVAGV